MKTHILDFIVRMNDQFRAVTGAPFVGNLVNVLMHMQSGLNAPMQSSANMRLFAIQFIARIMDWDDDKPPSQRILADHHVSSDDAMMMRILITRDVDPLFRLNRQGRLIPVTERAVQLVDRAKIYLDERLAERDEDYVNRMFAALPETNPGNADQ